MGRRGAGLNALSLSPSPPSILANSSPAEPNQSFTAAPRGHRSGAAGLLLITTLYLFLLDFGEGGGEPVEISAITQTDEFPEPWCSVARTFGQQCPLLGRGRDAAPALQELNTEQRSERRAKIPPLPPPRPPHGAPIPIGNEAAGFGNHCAALRR